MSLAGAIIEYISKNIKCKTLFSTHYHELTKMEKLYSGIKNVHVTISEEDGDITFLHKVLYGAVDKSYGINVAKLAELPEGVINEACRLLEEFETKDGKSKSKVHQYSLDLVEENHDELRDYLKNVNVNEITPIEALNILDHIKKIS